MICPLMLGGGAASMAKEVFVSRKGKKQAQISVFERIFTFILRFKS